MNGRGVIGKRIVRIRQERVPTNAGPAWHVYAIELEDGTRLLPIVRETDADYAVEILVVPSKGKRR